MRLLSVVAIAGLLVACGRPIDVRGLYVNDDGAGALVPCDQPKTLLTVTDSGLATRYRREATKPNEPLFVTCVASGRTREAFTAAGTTWRFDRCSRCERAEWGSARTWPTQPRRCSTDRSEEHTSELQSQSNLVCRLLLEKKKKHI